MRHCMSWMTSRKTTTTTYRSLIAGVQTTYESMLCKMDRSKINNAKLPNGVLIKKQVFGDVHINTSTVMRQIYKVSFVLDLKANLLNVSQLIGENYTLIFSKEACTIMIPIKDEIINITTKNNIFTVDLSKSALDGVKDNLANKLENILKQEYVPHNKYKRKVAKEI